MRRIYKSKAGFSLIEMIMVIAIIVILAGVMAMSISTYISLAESKSNQAASERRSAVTNISENDVRMSALGFGNINGTGVQNHNFTSTVALPSST